MTNLEQVGFSASKRQLELIDVARQIARDVLAKNADRYDREGTNPVDDYAALRAAGFYGMLVPEEYGGMGLDMVTYCLLAHELGQGSAATATAFNMHNFAMLTIDLTGTDEQKSKWYGKVINDGILIGGWGSEPTAGLAGGHFNVSTTLTPHEDGYLINGLKFFCTLAGVASYATLLTVAPEKVGDVSVNDIVSVIVPVDDPGVTVSDDWDVLGMRATVSPGVTYKNVFVPKENVLAEPGINIFTQDFLQAIHVGYAAIYSGLARAAVDFSIDYSVRKVVGPDGARHGQQPVIQLRIGELATAVDAAFAHAISAAWQIDQDYAEANRNAVGSKARAMAMKTVVDVTSAAFDVCGGTTVASRYPLGRYFRDARTQTLMAPGYDTICQLIGSNLVMAAIADEDLR